MTASHYAPDTLRRRGSWRDLAACLGEDPELFFPHAGDQPTATAAREVCARCPVIEDCLRDAMLHEGSAGKTHRHGILGGCTPYQRRALYERGWRPGAKQERERKAAARHLATQGYNASQIAKRLGLPRRTVTRWRSGWKAAS